MGGIDKCLKGGGVNMRKVQITFKNLKNRKDFTKLGGGGIDF